MKVLLQTWMCAEDNDVTYKIRLMVTFKTIDILWEINKGDKLNLTQCSLEVAVGCDPPPEPKSEPQRPRQRQREEDTLAFHLTLN